MDRKQFTSEYVGEFCCAICLGVPDGNSACLATMVCQHVFCKQCLLEWQLRSNKCPSCNREGLSSSPLLLKDHSALGFRLLNRLQVKCSLQTCAWVGDFANLEAHLTNSDTHRVDGANELKELGNERYASGKYLEAIKLYDKALGTATGAGKGVLLSNKAAALIKLERYRDAAEACQQAVVQGNAEAKVYCRWAEALLSLFDFSGAAKVLESYNGQPSARVEQFKLAVGKWAQAWSDVVNQLREGDFAGPAQGNLALLLQCPQIAQQTPLVARAAMVEAHVGDVDLALRLSLQCCRKSPQSELAWIARAYALCSAGELTEAVKCSKQAVRLDPDSEEGKRCFKFVRLVEQRVTTARQLATQGKHDLSREALFDLAHGILLPKRSPLRIQLLAERGNVAFQAGKYEDALVDCDAAIAQKPDCQRAWLTKFYCLRHLQRFNEAQEYAKQLMETWGSTDAAIKNCCEKAEFDWRKHNRPNLYQILGGLSTLASELEIKQAYKKWALVLHPDKAVDEQDRTIKEEQFKLLGMALEVLGNKESRELYDEGYDLQGIKDELERRRRRAHHH
ncbi:hypothetical protein BASA81_012427 [Batrachochytrium salamandrivorans]|nr:hypothetical protein BASA81_012427 [Batrachochytrium salamandrivorans]